MFVILFDAWFVVNVDGGVVLWVGVVLLLVGLLRGIFGVVCYDSLFGLLVSTSILTFFVTRIRVEFGVFRVYTLK